MALLSDYTAGTVTVAADGTTVTGVGTGWLAAEYGKFQDGDLFIANGFFNLVASVESNTSLTLAMPWRGGALSGAPYRLRYMSNNSRVSAQARQLIDILGGSGNIEALAGLVSVPNTVPYFTGAGTMGLITRQDLTSGVNYDVQVATIAARAAYNGQAVGFSVLVSDVGDGRSAIYSRVGAVGNWTPPAYVTGPAITLDITEVDEVPYGTPPDVILTPVAGGYDLAFEIPRGMTIEPGTTTTLAPDQPAAVTFVPITGGYRLDIAIPRGPTGDIDGVTPFWVTRLGSDTTAAAARTGLGLGSGDSVRFTGVATDAYQLAPIHVGNNNVNTSVDSQVLISRIVAGTSGNGHAFADTSSVTRSGNVGYNSFDAVPTFSGTAPYDHYTAFQARPVYNSTGVMGYVTGYSSSLSTTGPVTNYAGFYANNPTGAGTLTNAYGLYVPNITKGTAKNYAVYTAGATPSYFNTMPETGAEGRKIVESGSNANGQYVRFADGTQICTKILTGLGPVSLAWGNIFWNNNTHQVGNWAATFSAVPSVSMGVVSASGVGLGGSGSATTTAGPNITLFSGASQALTNISVGVTAVGRWF